MDFQLSESELQELRRIQKKYSTHRQRYIKATVLIMLHRAYSVAAIEDCLGIDDNTVYRFSKSYKEVGMKKYMDDNFKPYSGKLSTEQERQLDEHLRANCYADSKGICTWILAEFGVKYTPTGLVHLLHRLGYEYKQTKVVPGKANDAAQLTFLEETLPKILSEAEKGEAEVYFSDAVHPTHNTVSGRGWIKKGENFEIAGNSGRQRLNINAAINARKPEHVVYNTPESVNSQSTKDLCQQLLRKHRRKKTYVICDNARYNHNTELSKWVQGTRVELVFLPTYSPNLNLIERLWRMLRQKIINSVYFEHFQQFRQEIIDFLDNLNLYKNDLKTLLTLNFRTVGGTSVYSQTS